MALLVGLPIPLLDNFYLVSIFLWLYFYVGGCVMPIGTGFMISSVEPELRTKANSVAQFSYNLIGYFPAPFVYGFVCEQTGGKESRWGYIFNFAMNIPPCLLILFAIIKRRNQEQQEYTK